MVTQQFNLAAQVDLLGADSLLPPEPQKYVSKGAWISSDDKYRYRLWREWRGTHDPKHWRWLGAKDGNGADLGDPLSVLFVMLNPSTADGEKDDATIRKCVGFAQRWKYEHIEVVNLFAYRATKPAELLRAKARGEDIIGWRNTEFVQDAVSRSGLIVCAWGGHGEGHELHIEEVRGWLQSYGDKPQFHLGLTKEGHPRHPLYVPYTQELLRMPR